MPLKIISKLLLVGCLALGVVITPRYVLAQEQPRIDYSDWAKVLKTYNNDEGKVDYEALHANRGQLDKFIDRIETAAIDQLSRNGQKAFWINAYNALTLRLIIDHFPLKFGGIRTINWGQPWNVKLKAAGRELTLGEIEHEVLRKWEPADPRIHFAINCASIGCPRLPDKPFTPDHLDQQLHAETIRFINDTEKVRIDREEKVLYLSAIFKWFREDFLAVKDSLTEYVKNYLGEEDKAYLENNDVSVRFLSYDWGLNEQE